ncbi:hypothetical protein X943_003917 [Babesia divergens]|uniref:Coiled-coil domain-containing protein 43 n=1 Tax=Babesia divergens TaxID=32595 RepID=A0AAD9LLW1_BABDI|nr:hypothetical protein X943_003917 [Babesia divergens]
MSSLLIEELPKLGIEADNDIVSYLIELLETEGVDLCAEWLDSASHGEKSAEAQRLAQRAFEFLRSDRSNIGGNSDPLPDNSIPVDTSTEPASCCPENVNVCSNAKSVVSSNVKYGPRETNDTELDKALKREIVQRYACVEVQTVHIDEDGQYFSSGVALDNLEQDATIPTNTNAARVRQQQHEIRLSQKLKHLEEQEKLRQQKLKQQQRDERERLRCQKKERHK